MGTPLSNLIKKIGQGDYPPYIIIHGTDELVIEETAKKVAAAILPPEEREFNYDVLSGRELDFADLFSVAHTYPFLHERRLVIVKDSLFFSPKDKGDFKLTPEAKKRFADTKEVTRILSEEAPAFCTIIFTTHFVIKKTDPLYKLIIKQGAELSFVSAKKFNPQTDKTYQLAQEKLSDRGKTIDLKAYYLLLERCGNNSRLIFDELEKLATYIGDETHISEAVVTDQVARVNEESIFDFLDNLKTKQLGKALISLHKLREDNCRPEVILFMIIQHFRMMNQLRMMKEEGAFAKIRRFDYSNYRDSIIPMLKEKYGQNMPKDRRDNVLSQHPFVQYKTYQASLKHTPKKLRECLELLEYIDIGMKTSTINLWFEIENFVLKASDQPHVH